jgi:hypothetical protein
MIFPAVQTTRIRCAASSARMDGWIGRRAMAVRFYQLVIDARDAVALARWWAAVLDQEVLYESADEVIVGAAADRYPGLVFLPVGEAKAGKNRLHIDLDPDDYEAEVARVTGLGATPADIGQGDVPWTVLHDPEGNEFCILRPHKSLVE